MDENFLTKARNWFGDDEDDFSFLPDDMEKMPSFIYEQMKKDGMFKNEREEVDNYINEDALDVILDEQLLRSNPNKFISRLKKAIRLRMDSVVLDVISRFNNEKSIVKLIAMSNVNEYVAKVINMPLNLYERMINNLDDEDGKVEKFIKSKAGDRWSTQYIVVKTGIEKWLCFLFDAGHKIRLDFDELEPFIGNENLLLKLAGLKGVSDDILRNLVKSKSQKVVLKVLERSNLSVFVQNEIVKLKNVKFLDKLLDFNRISHDVQGAVLKSGDKRLIAKLLKGFFLKIPKELLEGFTGKKYHRSCNLGVHDFYLCQIVAMDVEEFIEALMCKPYLNRTVVSLIKDKGAGKVISKLEEVYDLYSEFENDVDINLGAREFFFSTTNATKSDYLKQLEVVQTRDVSLILKMIEEEELNPAIEAKIVALGNKELILKLLETNKIGYLAQIEIVNLRLKEFILMLLSRDDLNPLVEVEIIKLGNRELILKLFEANKIGYLAQMEIVRLRHKEFILMLLSRDDLNPLVEAEIVKLQNREFTLKLLERGKISCFSYDEIIKEQNQEYILKLKNVKVTEKKSMQVHINTQDGKITVLTCDGDFKIFTI